MNRNTTHTTHDWLSLVQLSGLLVSEPVLLTVFPDGPERVKPAVFRRLNKEYERFRARRELNRWVDFVLETLLDQPRLRWRKSHELPAGVTVSLLEYNQELRPNRVLVDGQGRPQLLVMITTGDQQLDRPETITGRWKASPMTKLDRLLRSSDVPLGLLTNGENWRLVYTGLPTTAHISWEAATWRDEKATLDGFYTLLNARRFDADAANNLDTLTADSQNRQMDVADQLGEQVRTAVSHFIAALDEADRSAGDTILAGMPLDALYEMALALVMRLVFVLYAEENQLLPHGDLLYDQSYGLTHLINRLERERQINPASLSHTFDAWPQLLALFRLIYFGCPHPDLNLRDYRGDLFDPARYANPAGQPVLEHPALRLSNETVYQMARQLAYADGRIGRERVRQRISYRTLDIEQIGYVYEGLLDHKVARAGEQVLVRLIGKPAAVVPLAELEQRQGEALVAYLVEQTDKKAEQLERWLAEARLETHGASEDAPLLPPSHEESPHEESASSDADMAHATTNADRTHRASEDAPLLFDLDQRLVTFTPILTDDGVILPDRLYITTGQSRRATGTHYTPQTLTEPIVRHTLEPLLYKGIGAKPDGVTFGTGPLISAREILNLKVCDMAMGSGAFLVQACRYLSERLVEAWETAELRLAANEPNNDGLHNTQTVPRITPYGEPSQGLPDEQLLPPDRDERLALARRLVAERCLYGVDKNPLAVEMARLSLWLTTLAKDRPFTFLNHALKSGDSLVGISNAGQFTGWSLDSKGKQGPILERLVAQDVQKALSARRQLARLGSDDATSLARKQELLDQANAALERVKIGCDLLVGTYLNSDSSKAQAQQRTRLLTLYTSGAEIELTGEHKDLAGAAMAAARPVRPFHWPFEFPEVFLDDRRGGFDAFIGNPPFLGGMKISTNLSGPYLDWLKQVYEGGNRADLCVYFFSRAFDLAREDGNLGLIATNTIAQGDSREFGLARLSNEKGGVLYSAIRSMPWPGSATLEVSVIHIRKGEWAYIKTLDGETVEAISPYLDTISLRSPVNLQKNQNRAFVGSNVGMARVVDNETRNFLIRKNPKSANILQPFLNGSEMNSHPEQLASRWAINFGDWSLKKAQKYPECLEVIRANLLSKNPTKKLSSRWWQFTRPGAGLYQAIEPLERLIAIAQTSKTLGFVFLPKGYVYSHMLVVFAHDTADYFAILQSSLHRAWIYKYSATLRTDIRYIPSDCFDTFPFPQPPTPNLQALEAIGEQYHEFRRQLMLARQEGLTATYNRFHDPTCHDDDIAELRRLHIAMDNEVLTAYGWHTDSAAGPAITLDHHFRHPGHPDLTGFQSLSGLPKKERNKVRYTLSDAVKEELLRRLLQLNFALAAAEQDEPPAPSVTPKQEKKKTADSPPKKGESWQPDLFGKIGRQSGLFDDD